MAGKKGFCPKIHTYYKVEGEKAAKQRKICSRCGKGVFMAKHKGRFTCGKCGLTEFS